MPDLCEVIRRAKRRGGRLVPWRMLPITRGRPGTYRCREGGLLVRVHNYRFARGMFAAWACGLKREGRAVWQPSAGVSIGCITHIGGLLICP